MSKKTKCLITSIVLILLFAGIFSENGIQSVNCSENETHSFENEETIVEVSSSSQLLQSSSLGEIQFNTKYQHSRFVTNPYNEPLLLNFSEGIIGCPSDYSENVTVENVYDGVDQCKNVQEQIVNLENDSLGQYYIDYENNVLIIYPRHHSKNEFYEYEIGATFEIPNPSSEKSVSDRVKDFFIPYECKFVGNLTDIPTPSHIKQDITGNFQLKFVLPSGLEIIPEESGYPSISTDENGHPIATYTKNSPITIPAEEKVVVTHIKSWREFLVIEIVSVSGMVAYYVYAKNKKISKKWNIGFTTIAGPAFILNIAQFVAIGLPGIPIFIILLISELVLLLLIIKNATSNETQKGNFSINITKQWIKF